MRARYMVAAALMVVTPTLFAASKPSAEEVDKVLDYYDNGSALGPVLVDVKLCSELQAEGELKNDCASVIEGNNLGVNQDAYVWMKLIVPKGIDKEKIVLQFDHKDVTRKVRELNVSSGFRFRTWSKFALEREGAWTVRVMYDNGEEVKKLAEVPVNITGEASAKK